jgi:putative CRISPR-associated protein (TIGR02620 family)
MNLIISRHPHAVEWLELRGISGRLIEHATGEEGHPGDSVYGPLPVDYVDKFLRRGLSVFFIALPKITLDQRKGELSVKEMDDAGACLMQVKSITLDPI